MKSIALVFMMSLLFPLASVKAGQLVVTMDVLDGQDAGKAIGTITVSENVYGMVFTPALSGLAPGAHGFHVHLNPSCAAAEKDGKMVPGLAAGGHYDPGATGKHRGPYAEGHFGDLPVLYADADGKATIPVLAPRLQLTDLAGRSLYDPCRRRQRQRHPRGARRRRFACGLRCGERRERGPAEAGGLNPPSRARAVNCAAPQAG